MRMARTISKEIAAASTAFALVVCGAVFAQQSPPAESPDAVGANVEAGAAGAEEIIFSNLESTPGQHFNVDASNALAGRDAAGVTEVWDAIRFTPKANVYAKELSAAIGYISGTKLVNLGIYTDNAILGTVGDPLPGGQGSTTKIPDIGECCKLATVILPGNGIFLNAKTAYWLVGSPDDLNGPTFQGAWRLSNLAKYSGLTPPDPWQNFDGQWPAAQIRGTRVQTSAPAQTDNDLRAAKAGSSAGDMIIFTNLGHAPDDPYLVGIGLPIDGNDAQSQPEIWDALPFTPKADVHAKTLAAAIAWISGTKLVNLGIYSDNGGTVGTPLPGGQGSTTNIPSDGQCCELTKVTLPGSGVALSKNVQYWLVGSPDNTRAPDFSGVWQSSTLAERAFQEPEFFINWTSISGLWLAAEIRGTDP
jgi:hypothetical protein